MLDLILNDRQYRNLKASQLKDCIHQLIKQGYQEDVIKLIFTEVYKACRKEFREDNIPTTKEYMKDCLADVLSKY